EAQTKNISIFGVNDPDYPERLKHIPDAPLFVYWQGKISGDYERSVAIVGTRQATEYGKLATEKIINELADYKPVIVSGFAYGIDIIAHKAALSEGLKTIGVLGGGLGKVYPALHKKYVEPILDNGALVSEYAYNVDPEQKHFPARNRIVAGMVDAVIVVEAAIGGGALITAELANSYNTDVFAVPGNLSSKYSEGCNELIRKNVAGIYTGVKGFAEMLNWNTDCFNFVKPPEIKINDLPTEQAQIYQLLKEQGDLHIDVLSWKSQVNMNTLAAMLLNMEISGWVKPLPGKKFKAV
ncbi:MAG: DNA-protecting protein DprA, partial [Opitutaceae bacterium]|nr:DNA-protecting protein DprA [Cytophagales bacterium]